MLEVAKKENAIPFDTPSADILEDINIAPESAGLTHKISEITRKLVKFLSRRKTSQN